MKVLKIEMAEKLAKTISLKKRIKLKVNELEALARGFNREKIKRAKKLRDGYLGRNKGGIKYYLLTK
jgi:hypothetical protein